MKSRFSNFFWGILLLLAAVFILTNKLNGFADLSVGSIVISILAVAFIVQCLANLHIAPLVIPIAVLYVIFRQRLGLPYIQTRTLIIAAVLAFVGLNILLPKRRHFYFHNNKFDGFGSDDQQNKIPTPEGNKDNKPFISVNFGAVSRSLNADCLETVQLSCNFGALEVYFNQVELSPNGAEVNISCSFGGIQLYVPRHWHVIDKMHCTLAGVDIKSFTAPADNAPRLTLNGSVSLGGVEVRYI